MADTTTYTDALRMVIEGAREHWQTHPTLMGDHAERVLTRAAQMADVLEQITPAMVCSLSWLTDDTEADSVHGRQLRPLLDHLIALTPP